MSHDYARLVRPSLPDMARAGLSRRARRRLGLFRFQVWILFWVHGAG